MHTWLSGKICHQTFQIEIEWLNVGIKHQPSAFLNTRQSVLASALKNPYRSFSKTHTNTHTAACQWSCHRKPGSELPWWQPCAELHAPLKTSTSAFDISIITILFNGAWSRLAMPLHANLTKQFNCMHLWSLPIALHNILLCTSRPGNDITHRALPLPRPCVNIVLIREMFKGNQYLLDADLRSVFLLMNKVRTSRE